MIHPAMKLISSNGYIMANKALARIVGINASILFGELVSEYIYYSEREETDEDGAFFSTMENIEKETTLSPYLQREAVKSLESSGLLSTKLKGIPAKRFFVLHPENLASLLSDVKNFDNKMLKGSSCENSSHTDVKNFDILCNNNNKNKNNNICISEVNKEPPKKEVKNMTPLKALEVYKEEFSLSPEVVEALKEFIEMRRRNKNNLTANGLKRDIMKLLKLSSDPEEQLKIIYQSVDKCWKGFFEYKGEDYQPRQYRPTTVPIDEGDNVIERLKKKYQAEAEEEERRKNATD